MELAADLFEQIAGALGVARDEDRPQGTDGENRRARRLAVSADVMVEPFGVVQASPRRVKLRSFSRTGAAILDALTRQTGDKLVLHLPKPDGSTVPVVCVVMNARMHGGEFRVGLQFVSSAESTGAAMMRSVDGLIDRPANAGPLDILDDIAAGRSMRVAGASDDRDHRVELNVQAMMSPYCDGRSGEMCFVTVKDISLSGVCILNSEPIEPGGQFVLQIARRAGKPLVLICTSVSCRRISDDDCRIGASFRSRLVLDQQSDAGWFGRVRRWLNGAASPSRK